MLKKTLLIGTALFCLLLHAVPYKLPQIRAEREPVCLPVIMYHAVVPDNFPPDKYTVCVRDLTHDLDYLYQNGYTTVTVNDLVAYTQGGEPLPEKPVMLTFDDGFYNIQSLAMPLLADRGQRAVCAVVGVFLEDETPHNVLYSYLNYEDAKAIKDSGVFEIANHTYDLHKIGKRKGAKKIKWEGEEQYKQVFTTDVGKLQEDLAKAGIHPKALAYPFGFFESTSDGYLKEMGFLSSFTCREGMNKICDAESLFGLKRYNRSGVNSSIEKLLLQAQQNLSGQRKTACGTL